MPFEKGHNIGRPKGSENKETKKIREWIGQFLDESTKTLEEDIKSLNPKDRVNAITQLIEYSVPKLQRTDVNMGTKRPLIINIGSTDDQPTDT